MVPELGEPTIREIFVRNHRLIYKVGEERIWILGFIACPRDLSLIHI